MRELFDELRIRDYVIIILIFLLAVVLSQSTRLIDFFVPKHNIENYEIEAIATILKLEPKYSRYETQEGSKLIKVGYEVQLAYELEGENIETKTSILYNKYKSSRQRIDSIINTNSGKIPIMINTQQKQNIILDTRVDF